MKDAARLLDRLIQREGSLTAAMKAMGTDKTIAYWSRFKHGAAPISREEYRLLRAQFRAPPKHRHSIKVSDKTFAELANQKPGLQTWDEWLLNMLALWNLTVKGNW